jgi:hypothetical protein
MLLSRPLFSVGVICFLAVALAISPVGKQVKPAHLLCLGVLATAVGVGFSLLFQKQFLEVVSLNDTSGSGRSVVIGYGIVAAALLAWIRQSIRRGK